MRVESRWACKYLGWPFHWVWVVVVECELFHSGANFSEDMIFIALYNLSDISLSEIPRAEPDQDRNLSWPPSVASSYLPQCIGRTTQWCSRPWCSQWWKVTSSVSQMLLFLRTLRKCRCCCAVLMTAEVFADQERLAEITVPRKVKCGPSPGEGRWICPVFPEVQDDFFALCGVQRQVVCWAPLRQFQDLVPVGRLISPRDQPHHCRVVCKLNNDVILIQEQVIGGSLRSDSLLTRMSGMIVLNAEL